MKNIGFIHKRRVGSFIMALLLFLTLVTPTYGVTMIPVIPILPDDGIISPLISMDYDYTVANGATTITKYKGTASNVSIPTQLGGSPVRVIGISAFSGNKYLASVSIPEGVTTLEDMAFYNCSNLVNVKLPTTLKAMNGEVFASCTKLTSVSLPDSLVKLDSFAFHNSGLTSLTIPKNVTDYMRLVETNKLTAIYAAPDNPSYTSVDGVLYSKDKKYLIHYPTAKPNISFNVPDGVTLIYHYAFIGTKYLENLTIPASVVIVGSLSYNKSLTHVDFLGNDTMLYPGCFQGCTALTNVSLPNNLKTIKAETFSDCSSLKSIFIPSTVTTIEKTAFSNCINLASINLPNGLKEIQSGTFIGCKALSSISIPETVQLINNRAFYGCTNLSTVTIPAGVEKMGEKAFYNCTNLVDVRFRGNAPAIGIDLFRQAASGFLIYYPSGKTGWTTPSWYGYTTKMYLSSNDLPAIQIKIPITFPIPSLNLQIPPISIGTFMPLPTVVIPEEDEEPELLPAETSPLPAQALPSGATEIKLYLGNTSYLVNGESQIMDASPVLFNNRILLPVRYIALPLGASTQWDPQNKKVTVTLNNTVIELWIDNNIAKINGVDKMIDSNDPNVKPLIVPPGRTMLPLRFLGESLGCEISWNQALQEATLLKEK